MTAGKLDFVIEQGATFHRVLTWQDADETPINLTGFTARMQARTHLSSEEPFLELTTENNRITINGAEGKITLEVDAETTDALNLSGGIYDLEVESSAGDVTRLLQGRIIVERSVTR